MEKTSVSETQSPAAPLNHHLADAGRRFSDHNEKKQALSGDIISPKN